MGKESQYEDVCKAEGGEINRPFFSIVVPAYNAERHIEGLLNCIDAQDFKDYELLIVNDGSTDRTSEIVCSYINKKKYSENQFDKCKTLFIDLDENKGAAEARNIGVEKSSGIYILFLDADDEISNSFLITIYTEIKSSKVSTPKLVVFGVTEQYFDENGQIVRTRNIIPKYTDTNDRNEIHKSIIALENMTLYGYLWNKVYFADHLKQTGIKIPRMRILEDIFFNIAYAQNIDSLVCIPEILYIYKKRNEGATSKPISDYYEIHRERMKRLYVQYESWNLLTEENLIKLSNTYIRYLYSAIKRQGIKTRRSFIDNIYNDDVFKLLVSDVKAGNDFNKITIMRSALKRKKTDQVLVIVKTIEITEKYLKSIFFRLSQ